MGLVLLNDSRKISLILMTSSEDTMKKQKTAICNPDKKFSQELHHTSSFISGILSSGLWQFLLFISPGISLEGMMLKLKLQYFGHLMWRVDSLEKTLMLGGIGGQEEKGTTEGEMAGWHHWLDVWESEWTPGVGDGQGGLVCCNSWGCKESNTTEWLNWTES